MTGTAGDIVSFGEKILSVLDRGSFTSTYKYAVLLGLLDLALEETQRNGAPPTSVTTHQLAERVIELYWPHTRRFPSIERVLDQNLPQKGKRGCAEIVRLIEEFRAADASRTTLHRARAKASDAWTKLMREVEWKLVEMPLPRLQVVGRAALPFLYAINWDAGVKRSEFNSPDFDNVIRFLLGSAENLVRLAGLLRPLIQREWAALISRFNSLPDAQLEDFLFSVDRKALGVLREPLADLQHGLCFYCEQRLKDDQVEVDHFIPWARHPNDAIENLVAAHTRCNASKSDHLAAVPHVSRWVARDNDAANVLSQISTDLVWRSDPGVSLGVARGIYLRLPDDTRLWRRSKDFEVADLAGLAAMFA